MPRIITSKSFKERTLLSGGATPKEAEATSSEEISGMPSNDDIFEGLGRNKHGMNSPGSYAALGKKLYDALTHLPEDAQCLLAYASTCEMSGEQMMEDKGIREALRLVRRRPSREVPEQ